MKEIKSASNHMHHVLTMGQEPFLKSDLVRENLHTWETILFFAYAGRKGSYCPLLQTISSKKSAW